MRCSHPRSHATGPSASAQPALITFKTSSASAGWASFQKLRYPLALCIITITLSNALVAVGYHLSAADAQVIGLSKFNRIVHHICERPQIQEETTSQIADALRETVKSASHVSEFLGSCARPLPCNPTHSILAPHCPLRAVVVKAEHHCMTQVRTAIDCCRMHLSQAATLTRVSCSGEWREHESDMTTAIMMGEFLANGNLRKEFYDILLQYERALNSPRGRRCSSCSDETQAAAAAYGAEVGVSQREVAVGLQGQDRVVSTISAKSAGSLCLLFLQISFP